MEKAEFFDALAYKMTDYPRRSQKEEPDTWFIQRLHCPACQKDWLLAEYDEPTRIAFGYSKWSPSNSKWNFFDIEALYDAHRHAENVLEIDERFVSYYAPEDL